jgi:hypothetical protein
VSDQVHSNPFSRSSLSSNTLNSPLEGDGIRVKGLIFIRATDKSDCPFVAGVEAPVSANLDDDRAIPNIRMRVTFFEIFFESIVYRYSNTTR